MYLLEDHYFYKTLEIMRNSTPIMPPFIELNEWVITTYDIHPIYIILEPDERIIIILRHQNILKLQDKKHINFIDQKKGDAIAKHASKILKSKLYSSIYDMDIEIKTYIHYRVIDEARSLILQKYGQNIWRVEVPSYIPTVFYHTDKDIVANSNSDLEADIKSIYYSRVEKMDEFHIYSIDNFIILYASKENVDKNFAGNLYYYYLNNA